MFLDQDSNKLVLPDNIRYIQQIIQLHPVLRLRDGRFLHQTATAFYGTSYKKPSIKFARQLQQSVQALIKTSPKLSREELDDGFAAMQQLLCYFVEQSS